jgi:hypothetical protein
MALAVTLLGTATFTTATGTKTVVATPAVGDLIVIVTGHSGNTSAATPTDDNSSGAYTRITSALAQAGVDTLGIHIRTALIGAAVSTTFTHAPGTSTGGGLAVFKVTGMQKTGASAARASAKQDNQAAGGTPTPVLAQAALTTNALIAAVLNATSPATLTPRASPAWTERTDVGYSTPTTGLEAMSINSGETGTSIAWGGTSASAFGSLVVELDANQSLTPGIYTDADTFFAPAVTSTRALTPSLVTDSPTFFAPTAAPGPAAVTPGLVTNGTSFHAPSVAAGAVSLSPGLVSDPDAFYAPAVGGTYPLSPALLVDAASFHAPAASATYPLTPGLLAGSQTFHAAAVTPGSVALTAALVTDPDAFYSPTVAAGAVDLRPPLVAASSSFHSATVGAGGAALAPGLLTSANTFHAASVSRGAVALTPALVAGAPTFHAAVVAPGPVGLIPGLVTNAASFNTATISAEGGDTALAPSLVANDNTFHPAAMSSAASLRPGLVTAADIFHAPSAASDNQLAPVVLVNVTTFQTASVAPGGVAVAPATVVNDNNFHGPTVAQTSDADLVAARFGNVTAFWPAYLRLVVGPYPLAGEAPVRPLTAIETYELAGEEITYPLASIGRTYP